MGAIRTSETSVVTSVRSQKTEFFEFLPLGGFRTVAHLWTIIRCTMDGNWLSVIGKLHNAERRRELNKRNSSLLL
jgi:hypothetical protein